MSVQVQHRRDTTTNLAGVTPAVAEVGYDTTTGELLYGNGATAGGIKLAKKSDVLPSTAAAAVADTDTIPVNQGATSNVKQTYTAVKTWIKAWITKTDVGLSNVDNTSDASKPVSTAQATAIALKAPIATPSFTGTVTSAGSIQSTVSPVTGPALSVESNTTLTVANGGNSSVIAAGAAALVLITNSTNWDTAAYMVLGAISSSIAFASTAAGWVAPTTTPAAGKISFAYDGPAGNRIYNNSGGSMTFRVMILKLN
jgi:hypothetical protein